MVAVSGHRGVHQPLGRSAATVALEDIAGLQVDAGALLARAHDGENQMDHHVSVGDQCVDGVAECRPAGTRFSTNRAR